AFRAEYAVPLHLGDWHVLYTLAAPATYMVSFLDKFLVGTPLSHAWVLYLVFLWALLAWSEEGDARRLVMASLAAAGMLLFHGVVGLSVLPVAFGTLAAALVGRLVWPWLARPGRLVALGVSAGIGFA